MLTNRTLSPALACCLLAAAAPAAAGEARLYLVPSYYATELSGEGRISEGSGGTDFDLEDTLGLDPEEGTASLEGFVKFLGSRIAFSTSTTSYAGEETLAEDLDFHGVTFGAGADVALDLDVTHHKVLYGFDFVNLKVVNFGLTTGAHLVDIEAELASAGVGRERGELRAPVPVVGFALGLHPVAKLAIHLEASGFHLTVSGVEATLLDGFLGVDYLFLRKFGATAGYRYFRFDASDEDEEDAVDLTQRGLYAGVALHL